MNRGSLITYPVLRNETHRYRIGREVPRLVQRVSEVQRRARHARCGAEGIQLRAGNAAAVQRPHEVIEDGGVYEGRRFGFDCELYIRVIFFVVAVSRKNGKGGCRE